MRDLRLGFRLHSLLHVDKKLWDGEGLNTDGM